MKKVVLTTIAAAFAVSVFAQGTINFQNRIVGSVDAKIYLGAPGELFKTGNTSTGFPAGTQTYLGAALAGAGYTAQLWGGANEAGLTLAGGFNTTTFRTGTGAGYIAGSTAAAIINGVAEGATALIDLRVWENLNGTIATWDAAKAAGVSTGHFMFTSLPLGGVSPPPNMVGLQSFNIIPIPEPATLALGLGGAALLIFRRRK